jgi:hypothetical protein
MLGSEGWGEVVRRVARLELKVAVVVGDDQEILLLLHGG